MKKFLLMVVIAATGTITANAQMKVNKAKVYVDAKLELTSEQTTRGDGEPLYVPNMYYYRPNGLFYSGWSKDYMNAGVSYAPANTDITFTARYADGSQPIWGYPSGEFDDNGEPSQATYEGDELIINLPKGKYFTPVIAEVNDKEGDRFAGSGYMHVGNDGIHRGVQEIEGEEYCNDGFAVNYVPTGNMAVIANYFCTNNANADKLLGSVVKVNDLKTTSYGELFTSNADFIVKGFDAFFFAEEGFDEKALDPQSVQIAFNEFLPETETGMKVLLDQSEMKTEVAIVENPTVPDPGLNLDGKFGVYHVECTFKNPIQVKAGGIVFPSFRSLSVQMSPLFDGQPRWDEALESTLHITTMFLGISSQTLTKGNESFVQIPSLAINSQFTGEPLYLTGWMMGLDMSYANAETGIDNVVAEEVAGNGSVYSIAGVKVSDSVENLPAGIYVKDGKKFVVR